MKQLIGVMLAVLATATQWDIGTAAVIQRHATLVVFPATVHPGDPIYVSGGGYPTSGHVPVALACPSVKAALNGNFGYVGPRPDSEGTFTAYRITAPAPLGRNAVRCQVVARHVGRGSAARIWGIPGSVTITPRGRTLPRCSVQMCLRASAFLVRLKGGAQGDIELAGWPGATATITISRKFSSPISRTVQLSWQGTRALRVMVAPGLARGMQARVQVVARLGRAAGQIRLKFHVLPAGR